MQESRILNLKATEAAILGWLRNYDEVEGTQVQGIKDLADGVLFERILSEIPKFRLIEEINTSKETSSKLHGRIKNMRILYDSLKRYYEQELQKDTSKFTVSLGELSNGGTKDLIKFLEFIIGAIMWSDKKKEFLEVILLLSEQHQETFMGLIKNAMNYSEEMESWGSSTKAKNLLERIDELEEENMALCKTVDEMKGEAEEREGVILGLREQVEMVKRENSLLISQSKSLQTPEKSSKDSNRLEYRILEQKLTIQKGNYECRINELEGYLARAEEKISEIITSEEQTRGLHEEIRILTDDVENMKGELEKSINLLKEKDSLLIKFRAKNQEYESRILRLQQQLEEQILKSSGISFDSRATEDALEPLKSHRVMTCLREEMNSIAQELTIQNSRLISQKLQKEQEYQEIILNQREEIRKLKQSLGEKSRERRRGELLSILKKENVGNNSSINVGKLVQEFTQGHHQELMVLIEMLNRKTEEVRRLEEEMRKEKETKEKRKKMLLERANLIHPIKIL